MYCCVTNYAKIQQLKTTHIYCLSFYVSGIQIQLSWIFCFSVSYKAAIKVLAKGLILT